MQEYQVLKTIAAGQFGQTLLVKDYITGQELILKKIKKSNVSIRFKNKIIQLDQDDVALLFHEEVAFLQKLDTLKSTYFPKYYGSFEDSDYYILVMEYVEGTTLESKLKTMYKEHNCNTLKWSNQLVDIFILLAENGLVYFDLNRENFIVQPDNNIKLVDYGLTCQVNSLKNSIISCTNPLIQKFSPDIDVKSMLLLASNLIYYIVSSTPRGCFSINIYSFRQHILLAMKENYQYHTNLDPEDPTTSTKILENMTVDQLIIYLEQIPITLNESSM